MYLSHRRRMDIKVFVTLPRLMSSNNYLFNITVDIFHSLRWQYHQCSLVDTIFNGLNFKIIASTTCACFLINGKHTTYTPIQVFLHWTPKLIKELFSYFFVTYKVYKLKQETICHFYQQAELVGLLTQQPFLLLILLPTLTKALHLVTPVYLPFPAKMPAVEKHL